MLETHEKTKHLLPIPFLPLFWTLYAPSHFACNMANEWGKEGEQACKHSLHARSLCGPHHVCRGTQFPLSACTLHLCANGVCRVAPPHIFATCPHSSDKTTSAGLAAAHPSRPCFKSGGIACTSTGHGKLAHGTTPAPCVYFREAHSI